MFLFERYIGSAFFSCFQTTDVEGVPAERSDLNFYCANFNVPLPFIRIIAQHSFLNDEEDCSGENLCFYLRAFEYKFREVFGSCEEVSYTHFFFLIERQAVLFSQICPERHLIRCMLFEISARSIPSPFSYTLPSLQARNTDNKGHKCPPNYNP